MLATKLRSFEEAFDLPPCNRIDGAATVGKRSLRGTRQPA